MLNIASQAFVFKNTCLEQYDLGRQYFVWPKNMLFLQARTQTFEKVDANWRAFTKEVRILRKFWFWGQSLGCKPSLW